MATQRNIAGFTKRLRLLAAVAIVAAGLVLYWTMFQHRFLHWWPGKEVTFTEADLKQVQWLEPEIDRIATIRVIAIVFVMNQATDRPCIKIITNPEKVCQASEVMVRAKRESGCVLVGGHFDMNFIFEDYTAMRFRPSVNPSKKAVQGNTWASKELYPVLEDLLGPFIMLGGNQ